VIVIFNSFPTHAADNATVSKQAAGTQTLTRETAAEALAGIQGEVLSVDTFEVPGIYKVVMKMQGQIMPFYLDATGSYLFAGNIIRIKDRTNLTEKHYRQLNPVDISTIPLADALTLGNPEATQQIVVFTDPRCPFCSKLHQVLHKAVKTNHDLAFQIKLLPLQQNSQKIAKTIICNKSIEQLDMAFSGQSLPESDCETDAIEANLNLAQKLGIHGIPILILPNGQIVSGYRPLEELLKLIEENRAVAK
jgi:thiol:disulfide interchange protein DsbC